MDENNGAPELSSENIKDSLNKDGEKDKSSLSCVNSSKNIKLCEERKFINKPHTPKYYNDRKITEKVFNVLEENIWANRIGRIENIDDILKHILDITLMNFKCCNYATMDFNEYVDHYINCHGRKSSQELYTKPSSYEEIPYNNRKRKYSIDKSLYESKIARSKDINNKYRQKIEHIEEEKKTTEGSVKTFKCVYSFCNKSYKSENGLKYHIEHGHKGLSNEYKNFICKHNDCNKRYKNYNGLKYHYKHNHPER